MKQNKHITHAIKFGIILGLLRVLLDVLIKLLDASTVFFSLSAIIGLVLEFIIVFIAIKVIQKKENNLTIKEVVKISIIMLMITGAMLFISVNFYHTEYAQNKLIELTKQVHPDQLEKIMGDIKLAKENPSHFSNFATSLVKFIMIGAIIGLINGLIVTFTKSIKTN